MRTPVIALFLLLAIVAGGLIFLGSHSAAPTPMSYEKDLDVR